MSLFFRLLYNVAGIRLILIRRGHGANDRIAVIRGGAGIGLAVGLARSVRLCLLGGGILCSGLVGLLCGGVLRHGRLLGRGGVGRLLRRSHRRFRLRAAAGEVTDGVAGVDDRTVRLFSRIGVACIAGGVLQILLELGQIGLDGLGADGEAIPRLLEQILDGAAELVTLFCRLCS